MSYKTFEQEKIAAMTELNDEEITNLVGGTYDGDLVDVDTGDIIIGNNNDVFTINPIVGLLSKLLGNKT